MGLSSLTKFEIEKIPRAFFGNLRKLEDIEERKSIEEHKREECVNIATHLIKELPDYFNVKQKKISEAIRNLSKKIYEIVYQN